MSLTYTGDKKILVTVFIFLSTTFYWHWHLVKRSLNVTNIPAANTKLKGLVKMQLLVFGWFTLVFSVIPTLIVSKSALSSKSSFSKILLIPIMLSGVFLGGVVCSHLNRSEKSRISLLVLNWILDVLKTVQPVNTHWNNFCILNHTQKTFFVLDEITSC